MSNIRPIEPEEMIRLIQHPRFSSLDNQGDGWKVWFFEDDDGLDYVHGDTLDDVMLEWAEVVREFEDWNNPSVFDHVMPSRHRPPRF